MYLRGLGDPGPNYYDSGGRVITSSPCGIPVSFDVPGYKSVWLDQTHNGQAGYSGVFPLPMASYTPNCASELGTWQNTVYTVGPQGQRGTLIGSDVFQVVPQQSGGGPPPPSQFTCPPGFYVTADAQSGLPACATNPPYMPVGSPMAPNPTTTPAPGPIIISTPGQPPTTINLPPGQAPASGWDGAGWPVWLAAAAVVLYLAKGRKG